MMEEEEFLAKAAGCPPGHTYNPVVKKCLPGSPLAGISGGHDSNGWMPNPNKPKFDFGKGGNAGTGGALGVGNVGQGGKSGKSGPSANAMIAAESYDRAVKAKTK